MACRSTRAFAPGETPESLDEFSVAHSVEDEAGLMRHLGIERAHIVGLSPGLMTTLHFSLRHPEMARSLVVAGTGPDDMARAKARFEAEVEIVIADVESKGWRRVAEDYGLTDDRLSLRDKSRGADEAFQERLAARKLNGPLQTLRRTVTNRPLLAGFRLTREGEQVYNATKEVLEHLEGFRSMVLEECHDRA